jgi:hypothetical protein
MNEFLKFLFNFETVNDILRPEWVKLYDFMYVDSKLIAGLHKNYELFNELITYIHNKASAGSTMLNSTKDNSYSREAVTKKVTIPEPFNLTKPKPRKLLEPLAIQNKVDIKPVPKADFEKTNLTKLEEESKKRKTEIKKVIHK